MSYRELFKRSFVTCVTCVTCPCPALRSSVSCSTLWWLPTLPTSQQPQWPLKSDRWKEWSHVSASFPFVLWLHVGCLCMSLHVSGALHLAHCIFVTVDPYDTSAWIQVFESMHCRIAVNLVIGFFDLVETLRPQGFGSGCFSPQSSLRLIGPLLFAKLGKSKNCLASSQHVTLHNNTQYAVYLNFSAHCLTCLVWRKNDVKPNFVRILLTQRQRYPAVLESATCLKPWFHETNCCFLVIVLFVFCESTETGIRIDNSDREDNQQELLFPVSNDVLMYLKLQLSYFLLLFI